MSDNPLTRVLLTAIMNPSELKNMARNSAKETFGLVLQSAGAALRESCASTEEDAEEKENPNASD